MSWFVISPFFLTDLVGDLRVLMLSPCAQVGTHFRFALQAWSVTAGPWGEVGFFRHPGRKVAEWVQPTFFLMFPWFARSQRTNEMPSLLRLEECRLPAGAIFK